MTARYIKVRIEGVLPVPGEIQGDLDAVAEAGLEMLRELITANVTTLVPNTITSSWQSMPRSWQPKRSNVILEEEVTPGFIHRVDSEERVSFIEDGVEFSGDDPPKIIPPPSSLPPAPKELESGGDSE